MFVMLFMLVPKQKTLAAAISNEQKLDGVSITINGVESTKLWRLYSDGYYNLDPDGADLQSNGLFPQDPNYITIQSTNTDYKILGFKDPIGTLYTFDLSQFTYITFLISYVSLDDSWIVTIYDTGLGSYTGYPFQMMDFRIVIRDEVTYAEITETQYNNAYNEGFAYGYNEGNVTGLINGYENGLIDGRQQIYDNGLTAYGFSPLTSYDYDTIRNHLYTNGFGSSLDNTSFSYYQGYSVGLTQNETDARSLTDFIPGILGALIGFILQIASIEFMGISLLDILVAVVSIIGVLIIFKIFVGK
jgi:hypothetical protein